MCLELKVKREVSTLFENVQENWPDDEILTPKYVDSCTIFIYELCLFMEKRVISLFRAVFWNIFTVFFFLI